MLTLSMEPFGVFRSLDGQLVSMTHCFKAEDAGCSDNDQKCVSIAFRRPSVSAAVLL